MLWKLASENKYWPMSTYSYNKIPTYSDRIVGILWKSYHLETKKMIYHTFVESHLNYAIVAWISFLAKNITSTENLSHISEVLKQLTYTQNKVIQDIFRSQNTIRIWNHIQVTLSCTKNCRFSKYVIWTI